MAWTNEQKNAISLEGNNIIVSAGAGSGKTAVLTERVLRKVLEGTHINELLIMTFTNAAAKEMKERIRQKLKDASLNEEVNLVDSSYITTFDSFALSLVKKYHYLLNLEKNISITDSSILNIEKVKLMDRIFDEYYLNETPKFQKLIKNFCYKDDTELKKLLIKLNDKLDMKIAKSNYLDNYITLNFSSKKIKEDITKYYQIILEKINTMKEIVKELSLYLDSDYISKIEKQVRTLFNSNNYNDVVAAIDFKLPNLPANTEEAIKKLKDKLSKIKAEIKKLCIYKNEQEIELEINATKENIEMIIEIITVFDKRFQEHKKNNLMVSFQDISKLAIKLLEQNEDVQQELRDKFQEIMVDEYQDTNDIQEYFISLISRNNVYMVGDIKQSIYRFRNANPYIFKNKYDLYANGKEGIKIDLVKNFRSRQEVLDDINLIFNLLMDQNLGGANYRQSHQMLFGNTAYKIEGKTDQDYQLEVLAYDSIDANFNNNEKECFIIGTDIKTKIENKIQVFDKDKKILRCATYDDFVILIDRATDFDLYKKIFEYLNIPLTLWKDEEIKSDSDILIIKNILRIEQAIDKETFDEEFKYAYLSLGRSFLFEINDKELFETFSNNSFKESIIYKKCEELYNCYYEITPKMFFLKLLEIFEYEKNILKLTDIKTLRIRLEYFYQLLDHFGQEGKTIEEFIEYLDLIFENDDKATFSLNNQNSNSVKIMTIHKSKGLEYPFCYFAGFYKKFSFKELNDTILYSNKYGIIIPYFNSYQKDTIYKELLKYDTKKEELSEKIRLFYVALTRAKEKMIMVIPELKDEKIQLNPSIYDKANITSFLDMIYYVYNVIEKYIHKVDIKFTKDYLNSNMKVNLFSKKSKTLKIEDFDFEFNLVTTRHFSKNELKKITIQEKEKMLFGTKIHQKLEAINFKHPNYELLSEFEKEKISKFIASPLIQNNLDGIFYKEFEFVEQDQEEEKHGIIDLMIETKDKIIIIDYKLKHISLEDYKTQLLGYKDVIAKRSNKKIELYLYSILDNVYESIEK